MAQVKKQKIEDENGKSEVVLQVVDQEAVHLVVGHVLHRQAVQAQEAPALAAPLALVAPVQAAPLAQTAVAAGIVPRGMKPQSVKSAVPHQSPQKFMLES